jgi:hypothetical protein
VPSPLENLAGPGQPLRKEVPDAKELAGLKQSGLRRLADAENAANSLESRFDLAYNAAHALSLAALRRAGYQVTSSRQRRDGESVNNCPWRRPPWFMMRDFLWPEAALELPDQALELGHPLAERKLSSRMRQSAAEVCEQCS